MDLDDVTAASETESFQYCDKVIQVLEAINDDACLVVPMDSNYIGKVNKRNKKKKKKNIIVNSLCVTDSRDVYVTDYKNKLIVRLSPSGSVSTVFSTAPLEPGGICQSIEKELLVSLIDEKSEPLQLNSQSRRLVRHVTLTGEVIHEYEYQEDGQTRLFIQPYKVKQNGNADICVINRTRDDTSELVVISFSGKLKSVYRGQNPEEKCLLSDIVCDTHCNIIVSDFFYNTIHLLSQKGEFMKYLLTDNDVSNPLSLSLYKSTLWIGDFHGLIQVFVIQNYIQCY